MTQEELNELASDCRLAFGHQAGAYNDGVDAMLRAVSIAQAQAAVEPVGKVLEVAADGSFQTGFFEELPVGTLLYTSPPDPGGLLRDALSNLNDLADQKNAEIDALQIRLNVTLDNYGNTTRERDAMRTENAQLKAELAARWIPITERLPEPEVSVLCYGPNTIQPDLPWIMFVDWRGSKPDFGRGVTHWRPLPAGPGANHG